MRFIPVDNLKDGMILGRRLIGKNGELLLNKGVAIHSSYIDKIKSLGYNRICIDDEISKDIEIKEIISDNLRYKTVNTVKTFYKSIERGQEVTDTQKYNFSALVNEILDNLLEDKNVMINMVDLKIFDDYTFFHSVNVGILSMSMGVSLNYSRNELYNLGIASILHDIGKVYVPKEILNKPGKFNDEEFSIMKTHSHKGYEYLLNNFDIPPVAALAVLDHHERFDGSGYPNHKTSDKISPYGKIISIMDVYDALTSDRPYRKAMSPSNAIEYIMGNSGSHFNSEYVDLFLKRISPYPVGTIVDLSNNSVGIVMENYTDCCLRPKIKILEQNKVKVTPYIVNLRNDREYLDIIITGTHNSDVFDV